MCNLCSKAVRYMLIYLLTQTKQTKIGFDWRSKKYIKSKQVKNRIFIVFDLFLSFYVCFLTFFLNYLLKLTNGPQKLITQSGDFLANYFLSLFLIKTNQDQISYSRNMFSLSKGAYLYWLIKIFFFDTQVYL